MNRTAGGRLDEATARHFMQQLAAGLRFLKQHKVVHRDLKPANLLLQPPSSSPPSATATGSGGSAEAAAALLSGHAREAQVVGADATALPVLKIADFGFARTLEQSELMQR